MASAYDYDGGLFYLVDENFSLWKVDVTKRSEVWMHKFAIALFLVEFLSLASRSTCVPACPKIFNQLL
jgi:hypothetical protein